MFKSVGVVARDYLLSVVLVIGTDPAALAHLPGRLRKRPCPF